MGLLQAVFTQPDPIIASLYLTHFSNLINTDSSLMFDWVTDLGEFSFSLHSRPADLTSLLRGGETASIDELPHLEFSHLEIFARTERLVVERRAPLAPPVVQARVHGQAPPALPRPHEQAQLGAVDEEVVLVRPLVRGERIILFRVVR